MVERTISHYKILSKLGQGGMGEVWLAEDLKLGREVALKFLAPHLVSDPEVQKRFEREAKAAASLNHPNICHVYEIDEAEGKTFLAMELVKGESLEARIGQGRCRSRKPSTSPARAPKGCRKRTPTASCIATSSRATS